MRLASNRLIDDQETSQAAADTGKLDEWLRTLIEQGGSDLLLVPDVPPCIRFEGDVKRLDHPALSGAEIEAAVLPVLSSRATELFRNEQITDASYRVEGLGRFRINLHRERGLPAAAIRALPSKLPTFRDLNLPPGIHALAPLSRGLVLVGGSAGAGKTTTLAALVNEINRREARHIITIEDPIEYEHPHIKSVVEQIEIGVDAPDFPTALRAALRQAPDIVVVGEMRDPETMHIAVSAAETGHLVLSTVHTTDVPSTISRISDSFPLERQNTIRQELAMALSAVLTQVLVPSKRGGRVPGTELLIVGYGARQHIRRNGLQHIQQEITMSKSKGSYSLEESLARLIRDGHLDREDALGFANHPDDLNSLMKG
jgi:twitching motility protein PilT